jgi:hypothetical protein
MLCFERLLITHRIQLQMFVKVSLGRFKGWCIKRYEVSTSRYSHYSLPRYL